MRFKSDGPQGTFGLEIDPSALHALRDRFARGITMPLLALGGTIIAQMAGSGSSVDDQVLWWTIRWFLLMIVAIELMSTLVVRSIVLDRDAGEILIEEADAIGLVRRRRLVQLSDVRRLCISSIGPGRFPVSGRHSGTIYELWLNDPARSRRVRLADPEDCLAREQHPIFVRLGRALGLEAWRLDWSDCLQFHITLGGTDLEDGAMLPTADCEPTSAAFPPLSRWGRGEAGESLEVIRSEYLAQQWKPGAMVSFERPAQPLAAVFWLGFMCFTGALVVYGFSRDGSSSRGAAGLIAMCFSLVMLPAALRRRSRVDWERGACTAGWGLGRSRLRLNAVRGIEVYVRRISRTARGEWAWGYAASVRIRGARRLLLPGRRVVLF